MLLNPRGCDRLVKACFVPKCTLFVRKSSNGQNRHFGPSGEAPPKLLQAWRAPAGQAFADMFANSKRRILDKTYTIYTDLCPVMYRSIVLKSHNCGCRKRLRAAQQGDVARANFAFACPCKIRTLRCWIKCLRDAQ